MKQLTPLSLGLCGLLVFCSGCSSATSTGSPAEAAMEEVTADLMDGNSVAVWEALPESYQNDINEIVQLLGQNMDPEVWGQVVGLLRDVHSTLDDKKEFMMNSEEIRQAEDPELARAGTKQGLEAFGTLIESIEDLESMKSFSGRQFFETTGKDLTGQFRSVMESAAKARGMRLEFKSSEIQTVESTDTTAKLLFAGLDDGEDTIVDFVLHEGKWLPKSMVDGWSQGVEQAKAGLQQLPQILPQLKFQIPMVSGMINGMLGPIKNASTQEEFDQALKQMQSGAAMFNPMSGGGSPAAPGGAPFSPGNQ